MNRIQNKYALRLLLRFHHFYIVDDGQLSYTVYKHQSIQHTTIIATNVPTVLCEARYSAYEK